VMSTRSTRGMLLMAYCAGLRAICASCGRAVINLEICWEFDDYPPEKSGRVWCCMSLVGSEFSGSVEAGAKRRVSIGRDGNEFVVTLQPEDLVVFRNASAVALRKVCRHLRWEIVSDSSLSQEALSWSPAPIPIIGQTL
jgi:hypothetical protein